MEKTQDYYEIISAVISRCQNNAAGRDAIKMELKNALQGCDYPSAVVSYLWGAYYNLDDNAQEVFQAGVFSDLKEQYPSLYDFFSFYFENKTRRRGFDRRSSEDRRKGYSLDYCAGNFVERRFPRERRDNQEKRTGWTRLEEWVSVPFNLDEELEEEDMGLRSPIARKSHSSSESFPNDYVGLHSLDIIVASLNIYWESYMQPGQTEWMDAVSPNTLESAEKVMKKFIAVLSRRSVNAR
jgi:hypothetical protein